MKVVLFNKNSVCPWQADADTQVMVTNRNGIDIGNHFCRAGDVEIGDNVWEHNIVTDITPIDALLPKVKIHYGPKHKN